MSCHDCEGNPIHGAYLRFGNDEIGWGDIEVVACKKHWTAARAVLLQGEDYRRIKIMAGDLLEALGSVVKAGSEYATLLADKSHKIEVGTIDKGLVIGPDLDAAFKKWLVTLRAGQHVLVKVLSSAPRTEAAWKGSP